MPGNTRPLTPIEAARSWTARYRHGLDALPDSEVAWEVMRWRRYGLRDLAVIGELVLAGRTAAGLVVPDGARPADLDALWRRVDESLAIRLVHREAVPLAVAIRLLFWSGVRGEERVS
jgi:hypothetical protein